jgi:hypothetical protein
MMPSGVILDGKIRVSRSRPSPCHGGAPQDKYHIIYSPLITFTFGVYPKVNYAVGPQNRSPSLPSRPISAKP